MTGVALVTLAAGLAILVAPTAAALAVGVLAGWIARSARSGRWHR